MSSLRRSPASFILALVLLLATALMLVALDNGSSTSAQLEPAFDGLQKDANQGGAVDPPNAYADRDTTPPTESSVGTKPPIESALSNVVQAENGTFMVTIDPDGGTPFLIADLDDPAIMKQYTAANQARNEALIRTGANQQVDVLVTFAHPVTWREFVALREETGLTPFQYYFAEIRADGEKVVNFHRAVPDDELLASVSRQLERDGAELLGVMVVEGSVQASSAALGRLLSFPSVLLADTTWIDAVDLLVRHGYPVRQVDEGLDVSLTTPYWDLDWAPGS